MSMISFFVPGTPVGKGRPRAARRGSSMVMFTPEKTANYSALVADHAGLAMAGQPPLTGPLEVCLDMQFPIPSSWSKAHKAAALAGTELPTGRPDVDNVAKAILDACNGVVFRDDAQVVVLVATKRFSEAPRVGVVIRDMPRIHVAHAGW